MIGTSANLRSIVRQTRVTRTLPYAPSIFICHDSRDKRAIARPIAQGLTDLDCDVWFDESKLGAGDRLRACIEQGLKECEKCVVILTPCFLKNLGWARTEFDAIIAREIRERRDIVLPVWAGVSHEQVARYCLALADRVGVQWTLGCAEVVRRLYVALIKRTAAG
jgi:TIR domain